MKKLLYLTLISFLIFSSCETHKEDDSDNPVDPGVDGITLSVTAPSGGEQLQAGGSFEIKWTSNTSSNLRIEYTVNNAESWTTIANSTSNDGSYIWTPIPNQLSDQCRIRITVADSVAANALSDGFFTIVEGAEKSITVSRPAQGETLLTGMDYTIQWVSVGVSSVKIDYSTDNGGNWLNISPSYPADSSKFTWSKIPDTPSETCLIRLVNVADETLFALSGGFSIKKASSLMVLQPNGGEDWEGNSTQTITWYSSEVANVSIEYSSNNGVNWTTIAENIPSTGYYTWSPVPVTPSAISLIRVTNADGGYPSDVSDSVFTVSPEPALAVVAPNGGENWMSGSSQEIKWASATGFVDGRRKGGYAGALSMQLSSAPEGVENVTSVKLDFSTDNGATWTSITTSAPNNGSYFWESVPSHNSALCLLRVADAGDGVPFDVSDDNFTIYNTSPQTITVLTPDGGEIWEAGNPQDIVWNSEGVATVDIEYTTDNGVNWKTIAQGVVSNGLYHWSQVPNSTSTNCKVRISDAEDGFPSDVSNAVFTISPEPEITVVKPNGGESWLAGSNNNIRWTSANISHVNIEFSSNGGAEWVSIAENTPSDGIYEWNNVPDVSSALCKVRISDAEDGRPLDLSDDNFEIYNQVVQSIDLLEPDGGEEWEVGTSQQIIWNATGIDEVQLHYTTNNGLTWVELANNVANSGSYDWNPVQHLIEGEDEINSTQCKIRVADAADGNPSDESGSTFTIQPTPEITVLTPTDGEEIFVGEIYTITWESVSVNYVTIEYSTNNGGFWTVAAPRTASDGEYKFSFPKETTEGKIRVQEAENGYPAAESPGRFVVSPPRRLILGSPAGGEDWIGGNTYEIIWSSEKVEHIDLYYSTNAGYEWNPIAAQEPSDGSFTWTVPDGLHSENCKVRIQNSINEGKPFDISDTLFSIRSEPFIRVTYPNGGDVYAINEVMKIGWISNEVEFVDIEYSLDNGVTWHMLENDYPSYGEYDWLTPNVVSGLARVRVTSSADPTITDMSDSYFYIRTDRPGLIFLEVEAPVENAIWPAGSTQEIAWVNSNNLTSVDIYYSPANGWEESDTTSYINIVERHPIDPNNGVNSFTWNIPGGVRAEAARIKIVGSYNVYSVDGTPTEIKLVRISPTFVIE